MQGRLLPKYQGRYQAHPVGYWQSEFLKAAQYNLDCIEFIVDANDIEKNPLLKQSGITEIQALQQQTGVMVHTICADYLMDAPLHHYDSTIVDRSQQTLLCLLDACKSLSITDIVIPCVDQSSLRDKTVQNRFVKNIVPVLEKAEFANINLALETDLAPVCFLSLLQELGSKKITVNYDIGNSAALGYDPLEELECYGLYISDVHIKDRLLGGGSIELGYGNAQFDRFFGALEAISYAGIFIMQAYRDDEGLVVFKRQLDWIRNKYLQEK